VIPAILNENEKEDSKKYAGIKYGQEYEYRSETYFKRWACGTRSNPSTTT
jgi:hypothetical protein